MLEPLVIGSLSKAAKEITPEEYIAGVKNIVDRVNILSERGDLDKGEIDKLSAALKELQSCVGGLKPKVDSILSSGLGGGGAANGHFVSGQSLTLLKPPKGVSAAHFNLVVRSANELSIASQIDCFRHQYAGLSRIVGRRPSGMSDAWAAKLDEFQAANDFVLLCDMLLCGDGNTEYANISPESRAKRIVHLRAYPWYKSLVDEFVAAAGTALDTQTSDQGLEWVPTMYSSRLQGLIQADLVVANLFDVIQMPASTYVNPVAGLDTVAYKLAENIEESGTKIPSNTFGTKSMTLIAQKMGTRMLASTEITEDSLIPIMPRIMMDIAKAMARAKDDAIMNGDTTATHFDADVTASTDRRKLVKGLRRTRFDYGTDANGHAIALFDAGGQPLTYRDLMGIRKDMKVYGSRPRDLTWIVGFRGSIEISQVKDDSGRNIMMTIDKYGPDAVIMTGEIGQIGGVPVVLSEFAREDLDPSGVNVTSGNNTTGVIQCVNRGAFVVGERRAITMVTLKELYAEYDQVGVLCTERWDFKPWYAQPANVVTGTVINVA